MDSVTVIDVHVIRNEQARERINAWWVRIEIHCMWAFMSKHNISTILV